MFERMFACHERRGSVMRRVVEVEPSALVEKYLSDRLPQKANQSPIKDLSHIYSRGARTFLVDDVGVMLKGIVNYSGMCDVHIGFWDCILNGRESMCRDMAAEVAEAAGLPGVWTAIPLSARATLAFAKRVGFVEQGQSDSVSILTLLIT